MGEDGPRTCLSRTVRRALADEGAPSTVSASTNPFRMENLDGFFDGFYTPPGGEGGGGRENLTCPTMSVMFWLPKPTWVNTSGTDC